VNNLSVRRLKKVVNRQFLNNISTVLGAPLTVYIFVASILFSYRGIVEGVALSMPVMFYFIYLPVLMWWICVCAWATTFSF
jgi:hypothetical protein